jgi:hypothetical protein
MRKFTSLFVCLVAVLAIAAPAYAQSVTQDVYQGEAGAQQGGGDTGGAVQAADSGGSLPFTGSELGIVALVGAALVGGGYAMRRVAHFRDGNA